MNDIPEDEITYQKEYAGQWWGIPGIMMEADRTPGLQVNVFRARGTKKKFKIEVMVPDLSDDDIDWYWLDVMIRRASAQIQEWLR